MKVRVVDMWGRMCTTGVGPAGSVDRAEDTVGVVLFVGKSVVPTTRTCDRN